MEARQSIAGFFLFFSILASLGQGFGLIPSLPAGLFQVIAVLLLWSDVPASVRRLGLLLVISGAFCLLSAGEGLHFVKQALTKNQALIAMFAAVGFLRLVPLPVHAAGSPTGRRALWQTLFGVHWFGAFANISAIVLFGDRIGGEGRRLSAMQGLLLTRGFALAALWSPFFIAMGVAITNAPGARITQLILWGLPLSQLLLAALAWRMSHLEEIGSFSGYPITFEALFGPILLATGVIVAHYVEPKVPVISVITLFVPLYALFCVRKKSPFTAFLHYVRSDLPRLGPELLLFFSAGVLGAGLGAIVDQVSIAFIFNTSGAVIAVATVAIIVAFSSLGIHPVISISALGTVLAQSGISPDLLAMSFLIAWGLGVLINPISGIHLLLSGRYGFQNRLVWRHNAALILSGYAVCSIWLILFDHFS